MIFEDDNSYPDCPQCGSCCRINTLCMTEDDFLRIREAVRARNIIPTDYGKRRCCFQRSDMTCGIWDVRPQICRLYNCNVPRFKVLEMDPSIEVDEGLWLVDMHEAFVNETMEDEIERWGSWSADGQTPAFLAATRMASLSARNMDEIIGHVGLADGMSILDVGCGSGEYTFKLGSRLANASFTGLDFDAAFVEFATARAEGKVGLPYEQPNPENAYRFVRGDAADLPFDDASFNAVVSHTFLTAAANWETSLKEMRRVCKPGGTVSSVTSLTDDFFGTGTVGLFSNGLQPPDAELVERVREVRERAFPTVDLVGGIAPRDVPAAFAAAGFRRIRCLPLGHYFCLSDAGIAADDYLRHVELLRIMEEESLARLLSNRSAKAQLPESDWERFAELIERRSAQLVSTAGSNSEWNWYGNASLLVCGDVDI